MRPPELAPYAIKPADQSRNFPQASSDTQSSFAIDRQRIIKSSAFRRLDYKTQVFVPHELSDHFRTRLTHSLEVAQVARRLARALGCDEDLAESSALAHDLGHPPFGHVGERILDDLMHQAGGFEHNAQSLRIVDFLEHPFADFRGLNLTSATREAIAKHETAYDQSQVNCDEFPSGVHPPLVAQIVCSADEIAYTCADLEDALAVKWIAESDLAELKAWRENYDRAKCENPRAHKFHIRIATINLLFETLIRDLLTGAQSKLTAGNFQSPADIRNATERIVKFSPQTRQALSELQKFLLTRVYRHENNRKQDAIAKETLTALFEYFEQNPKLLPERYRKRIGFPDHKNAPQSASRVICDYISGMTDRFCRDLYKKTLKL